MVDIKDLAIDNIDLRKENTKKIINCVESVNDYVKEGSKTAKTTKYYLIFMLCLFAFLFVGAIIAVAIKSGGIGNFIDNMYVVDNVNDRIICYYEDDNMTFRTPDQSYHFIHTFNNSYCEINKID